MNSSSSGRAMQALSGLPGRLVHASLITEEQAQEESREAVKMGKSLVRYVVGVLNVDSHAVAAMASQEFGVPLFDLTAIDRSNLPDKLIPASLMGKHHALPLYRRGNRLLVGVSDPTNLAALDEIKFATGISTEAVLVDETALAKALRDILDDQDSLKNNMAALGGDGEYDIEIADGDLTGNEDEDSLSSLVEPIIMSVLGVLVGGLMIAMYLPIFMLGSVV